MRPRVVLLTGLVLALCGLVSASTAQRLTAAPAPRLLAQDTATMPEASISLALATRMLDAMERRATELGVPVGLAIVDRVGIAKAATAPSASPSTSPRS